MWIVSTVVWPWMGATSKTKSLPTAEEQSRSINGKEVARNGANVKDPWRRKDWVSCQGVSAQIPSSVDIQKGPGRGGQLTKSVPGGFL